MAEWACSLCTFENDPARTRCEMCDTPKQQVEGDDDSDGEGDDMWGGLIGGLLQGGRSVLNGEPAITLRARASTSPAPRPERAAGARGLEPWLGWMREPRLVA